MKTILAIIGLGLAGALTAAPEPAKEAPVKLPTFVVIGYMIPPAWLQVSWECKGPLPYNLVKRAWISKVGPDTPAAKAGLKVGDTLLAIGNTAVEAMSGERLRALLKLERGPGTRLEFMIQTPGGEKRTVAIVFEEPPLR